MVGDDDQAAFRMRRRRRLRSSLAGLGAVQKPELQPVGPIGEKRNGRIG